MLSNGRTNHCVKKPPARDTRTPLQTPLACCATCNTIRFCAMRAITFWWVSAPSGMLRRARCRSCQNPLRDSWMRRQWVRSQSMNVWTGAVSVPVAANPRSVGEATVEILRITDKIEQRRRNHIQTEVMPAKLGKNRVAVPARVTLAVAVCLQAGRDQCGSGSGIDVTGIEEIRTYQTEQVVKAGLCRAVAIGWKRSRCRHILLGPRSLGPGCRIEFPSANLTVRAQIPPHGGSIAWAADGRPGPAARHHRADGPNRPGHGREAAEVRRPHHARPRRAGGHVMMAERTDGR